MKELIGQWILTSEEDDCAAGEVFISHYSDTSFSGSCIQADLAGSPHTIDGSIMQTHIIFSIPYLNSGHETLPIVYTGKYSKFSDSFCGTWEMNEESRKIGQGWLEISSTGTWVMKRK